MDKHNVIHMIQDTSTTYEVQRTNNFEFVVKGLNKNGRLYKAGIDKTTSSSVDDYFTADGGDNPEEILRLSLTKNPIPHFSQGEIEISRGNTKMYAAGVPEYSDGSFEFNDFIGLKTKDVLMAWQRLSFDVTTGAVGLMKDYKMTGYIYEYTPDYNDVVRVTKLEGCWIKEISESDRDYESNDKVKVTATIRYDRAIPNAIQG